MNESTASAVLIDKKNYQAAFLTVFEGILNNYCSKALAINLKTENVSDSLYSFILCRAIIKYGSLCVRHNKFRQAKEAKERAAEIFKKSQAAKSARLQKKFKRPKRVELREHELSDSEED